MSGDLLTGFLGWLGEDNIDRGRWPGGGYRIGPAPLGWRVLPGTCSNVIPHIEGDAWQNAEMNADHYAVDLDHPESIEPDMVLMFRNENVDTAFHPYPDSLVVVERLESGTTSWSGRRVWVTRLGTARMNRESRWTVGFFAHVRELSPVSAGVLEALGGSI